MAAINPAKVYNQAATSSSDSSNDFDFEPLGEGTAPSLNPNDYKEFKESYSEQALMNRNGEDETEYHVENDVEGNLDLSSKATTHEILEALSDQSIADDAEEQIESIADGEEIADADGFVVEHDHGTRTGTGVNR